jgi:hypothetical protein
MTNKLASTLAAILSVDLALHPLHSTLGVVGELPNRALLHIVDRPL